MRPIAAENRATNNAKLGSYKRGPLIKPDAKQERQLSTRSLGLGPASAEFVLHFGAKLAASRSDSLWSTQTISCPTLGMK
jgi:hypothetical protein